MSSKMKLIQMKKELTMGTRRMKMELMKKINMIGKWK